MVTTLPTPNAWVAGKDDAVTVKMQEPKVIGPDAVKPPDDAEKVVAAPAPAMVKEVDAVVPNWATPESKT